MTVPFLTALAAEEMLLFLPRPFMRQVLVSSFSSCSIVQTFQRSDVRTVLAESFEAFDRSPPQRLNPAGNNEEGNSASS
jgi:hypothetical protein